MCKPLWKDAPDWANFLAQDLNGIWYWYEYQPTSEALNTWYSKGRYQAVNVTNWRDSLQERPLQSSKLEGAINLDIEFEPGGLELLEEALAMRNRGYTGIFPRDEELQEVFDKAPDWAVVLCQDMDGDWFAYDIMPAYNAEYGYWQIPSALHKLPKMAYIGTSSVRGEGAFSFKMPLTDPDV